MTVSRDVLKDLLPIYVSGEASDDTRALVDAAIAADPEIAALAEALRDPAPPGGTPMRPLAPDRALLERTRRLLRLRTWLLAGGLFFSGLPLSFVFDDHGLRFLLLRDAPVTAACFLALGMACWIGFATVVRQTRVSGL